MTDQVKTRLKEIPRLRIVIKVNVCHVFSQTAFPWYNVWQLQMNLPQEHFLHKKACTAVNSWAAPWASILRHLYVFMNFDLPIVERRRIRLAVGAVNLYLQSQKLSACTISMRELSLNVTHQNWLVSNEPTRRDSRSWNYENDFLEIICAYGLPWI